VTGDELRVRLYLDSTMINEVVQSPPALMLSSGAQGAAHTAAWERMSPELFEARVAIPPSGWLRGVVQVGPHTLPFGPIGAVAQAEWLKLPEREEALAALARESGGEERLDLSSIWSAPLPPAGSTLEAWLLIALLGLILLDVLLTRLGVSLFALKGGRNKL
jgi:hypothetical protein